MTFKPNAYFLCQFLGAISLQSIVVMFSILGNKELTANAWLLFIENVFLSVVISHFFLRSPIKKARKLNTAGWKVYTRSVLISALIYSFITQFDYLIYSGFANQGEEQLLQELGVFPLLMLQLIISTLVMGAWCSLYVAITSIRDKKSLEQQVKEQQLATLMNQVNPHFLFNSLNTIRGMIFSDQEKAADLVTQLSNLFRYNLGIENNAKSNLKEELDICQQYLAIEAIRLGDRLVIEQSIPAGFENVVLPRMGILTLVENSVKHGIAHLQKGGVISLDLARERDSIVITVTNPYDPSMVKSGTKIGLKNLKQRLQIQFGESASVSCNSENNVFTAQLVLPI